MAARILADGKTTNDLVRDVTFESNLETDPKGAPKRKFTVEITFKDLADAAHCGEKFVVWTAQRLARQGELPEGRVVKINSKCEFTKTPEEMWAAMSTEDQERIRAMVRAIDEKEKVSKAAGKK